MRRVCGFALRVTVLHVLTYVVIGGISYALIAHRYWEGAGALHGLRDPRGAFVQTWMLPAEILRALLYAMVLYPLRSRLLSLRWWGAVEIAALMLILGTYGGITGVIETIVYTTGFSLPLHLAHLPEIVLQSFLFGALIIWWEGRVDRRRELKAKAAGAV